MEGKYIVWKNYGYEGWQPSEEFKTVQEATEYAMRENYGIEIKITKIVKIKVTVEEE